LNFGTPGTARVGPADGLVGLRASASTESELQSIFNINLFSLVALTHELLPLLRKSKAGRIINLASILGSLTLQSMEQSPIAPMRKFAYNASKAAVKCVHDSSGSRTQGMRWAPKLDSDRLALWFKLPDCS
jgi:NAD(P)-dependent dehydrogenase (short-subunit alcohol dehydrogenase family)